MNILHIDFYRPISSEVLTTLAKSRHRFTAEVNGSMLNIELHGKHYSVPLSNVNWIEYEREIKEDGIGAYIENHKANEITKEAGVPKKTKK